jgi:hypothetical protein
MLWDVITKSADYAPGIPKKEKLSVLPKTTKGDWELSVQEHVADRAKRHLDLRFVRGKKAYSFAMKGELPKPGEKVLLVAQPVHRASYAKFSGVIPSGYGKGTVSHLGTAKIDVLESTPNKFKFVIPRSRIAEEYALINLDGGKHWLMVNHSTTQGKYPLNHHKPPYKEMPFKNVPTDNSSQVVSAKIDGAHAVAVLTPGKMPRLFSYRQSRRNVPLEYTWKMPRGFVTSVWPKGQKSMMVRGEIYGVDQKGRAIPENELGRVLNSSVDNARKVIEDRGITMRFAPFQVESVGGKAFEQPYKAHLPLLRKVESKIKETRLPPMALDVKEKRKLLDKIKQHKLPETAEGVVVWDNEGTARPIKAKIKPDYDVVIRDVFMEKGQRGLAGGFTYARTPRGPEVGRIGTGFSHALKTYMAKHPEKIRGLVARVEALREFPSGALRAPAFKGFHNEKSGPRVLEVPA